MIAALLLIACAPASLQALDGQPSAVLATPGLALAALAGEGIGLVDPRTGAVGERVAPPEGVDGVHDLSAYNGLVLALDATPPGHVMLYDLSREGALTLVDGPLPVPVGPFSGLSMHNGTFVVAGGEGGLAVGTYSGDGRLGEALARAAPESRHLDVVVDVSGRLAYVSVRFHVRNEGERYGVISLALNPPPEAPTVLDRLYLPGAGRAPGQMAPAGYPMRGVVEGDHLFLAHGAGLAVIDVSDPADLKVETVQVLPVFGVDVAVEGDRGWVVGSRPQPALVELDLRRPAQPMIVETLPLPDGALPTGVAAREGRVLVAANAAGVLAFERRPAPPEGLVENPADPIGPLLELLAE